MRALLFLLLPPLAGCGAQTALRGTAQTEAYSVPMNAAQVDSVCAADGIPSPRSWDSLYVRGVGYMYLWADSARTYRIYRESDGVFNVTKRASR